MIAGVRLIACARLISRWRRRAMVGMEVEHDGTYDPALAFARGGVIEQVGRGPQASS
jgi:hypothetical protein